MTLGNLLAGGLTTFFGAALVGWILRKSAEKSLAESVIIMSSE
jgi:hypothetical protein